MAAENKQFQLSPQDNIVVVGAGGFTAHNLYLRNLSNLGVLPEQITLVDTDQEKLQSAQQKLGEQAGTYLDLDNALSEISQQGKNVPAIIIASSTAAHADNIKSIVRAADAGEIDLDKTKIWSEKPVTPPEIFDEIRSLAAEHPDLDISVGYILRYSDTLSALQNYIAENSLAVTGLEWTYGKDRTKDTRPTQGVFPDEVVHPLSVTDLVLTRALGEVIGVDVESADMQRRPFANPEVQEKARVSNPDIPENPTSNVDAVLHYSFNSDGTVTKVPVKISSSFLLSEETRKVNVSVNGSSGPDVLTVDFDVHGTGPDNLPTRVDTLKRQDGTVIYAWSGDKSLKQITSFLGGLSGESVTSDMATSLEGEGRIQDILKAIGDAAANKAAQLELPS